jgi:hypothetical protein
MFWEILEFLLIYLGLAGIAAAGIAWAMRRLPEEETYRLGNSVWLCPQCHSLYNVTHWTLRHAVIEATKEDVAAPMYTYGGYDPYATEALLECFGNTPPC